MNWLSEYISEAMIQVLGMTFLHSIWQGVLAVFLVSMAFYVVKNKRADVRYNISMGSMVVFFLAVCYTFAIYYQEIPDAYINNPSPQIEFEDQVGSSDNAFSSEVITETTIFNPVYDFLNRHAEALVLFWLVGIVVLSVRFAGGFLYIRKLRTIGLSPVSDNWQFKLEEWGLRIGLKKLPTFYESKLVKSPVAFGYLKPMILFPLGMLTSMPVQHLDAMLVHELMHIKNADYLTNLFLSVVEILFFFNPAVWWLSGVIRAEMEHRCDDAAVALTGSKINYAYALIAIQENQIFQNTELVLGMARNKSQLTERVNRLFGSKGNRSVFYGRSLISFVVLLTSVLLLAFSSTDETILDSQTEENLMKDSIASPKKEVYYFNNKIIDKDTFYKMSRDSVGASHGLILEDRVELRFYTDLQMYEAWKKKRKTESELGEKAKNIQPNEEVLIVDGEIMPIEYLEILQKEGNIGLFSVTTKTDKGKFVGTTEIRVTTKRGLSSNLNENKKVGGVTGDSLRYERLLNTNTIKEDSLRIRYQAIAQSMANKSQEIKNFRDGSKPIMSKYHMLVARSMANRQKNNLGYSPRVEFGYSLTKSIQDSTELSPYRIKENPGLTLMHKTAHGFNQSARIGFSTSFTKSLDQDSIPPLVIVDGVKVKSISMIDPKAIESMSVLKGKAAIEAYGEEGANGVMLITTKQIKDGAQDSTAMINFEINNYRDSISTVLIRKGKSSTLKRTSYHGYSFSLNGAENSSVVVRNRDSSQPLIVVDGVKRKNIDAFDPKAIKSLSVIKNKRAIDEYGEEGKDGVIIITTKSDREMKLSLDTKINVKHSVFRKRGELYLKGKVTGNVSNESISGVGVRFDGIEGGTVTGSNGEFEILIPVGGLVATISHRLGNEYIPIDRKKINEGQFQSDFQKSLKVFPNPASELVNIQLSIEEDSEEKVMVDIINLDGKTVLKNLSRKKLQKGMHEFLWDSNKEKAGVYLVTVQNGNERISKKVVIAR
ncbi:M56 family metallopeptidase [Reichenbachiella sp. MALMAid0571]|uniref:M56 family metallopeptidase n=1 Tax=Reichenbachiella sp. MALMAid0571 TaxID=3143939 RepID=UPI0032DEF294